MSAPPRSSPGIEHDVTFSDIEFAAKIIADFGGFEEGITDQEKLAQWVRNIRIAALRGIAYSSWQPIETAPKDGTEFIAFENCEIYRCCWRTEEPDEGRAYSGWWDFSNQSFENPTDWSPMPSVPSVASTDRGGK